MSYTDDAGIGLEVGRETFWDRPIVWPSTIAAKMEEVNTNFVILARAIYEFGRQKPNDTKVQPFVESFSEFYNGDWFPFYKKNKSSWAGSDFTTATEYADRYMDWRNKFKEMGGASAVPEPRDYSDKSTSIIKVGVWGGLILGGGYLIVKLIEAWKSPGKAKTPAIKGVAIQSPIRTVRG